MKQILIITRITNVEGEDEFNTLFPGTTEPIRPPQTDGLFSIHQGLKFFDASESETAKKIKAEIKNEASEVLIALHSFQFDKIKSELVKIQDKTGWQIRQYSTTDLNYETEIVPALKEVAKDSNGIETINKLFSYDPVLEAKLELLQTIAIGATRLTADNYFELDKKIENFQGAFDEFSRVDQNFFVASMEGFSQYKEAYDKFYDALEIEV